MSFKVVNEKREHKDVLYEIFLVQISYLNSFLEHALRLMSHRVNNFGDWPLFFVSDEYNLNGVSVMAVAIRKHEYFL